MDLTDRHRAREGSAPADERHAVAASEPAPHVPTDAVARPHPPASGEGPAVRVAPQPPSAGTAATPIPFVRKPALLAAAYALTSMLLSLSQGLGLNFVSANIYQLAGPLHATLNEANWLIAAYMAPNVSLSLMLIKIRNQYGLRRFAEGSIVCFVVSCLLYFWVSDLSSALVVRFISGIAASPMSSLGFLYMLELFPPETKFLRGLPLALTTNALGSPMARLLSPDLLDRGGWHRLGLLEMGIACLAFAGVYLLPLTSPPRVKTIEPLDFLSYGLLAIGFGAAAVVATLGRLYWWLEADWLGWLLALSLAALTASVLLELNRPRPFIDLRWLATPGMLYAALVLLLFRLVLSEQALGGSSFLNAIGLLNDQARGLNLCIVAATLAGGWGCALVFRPQNAWALMTVAMGCIAVGAWLDSHATDLTPPARDDAEPVADRLRRRAVPAGGDVLGLHGGGEARHQRHPHLYLHLPGDPEPGRCHRQRAVRHLRHLAREIPRQPPGRASCRHRPAGRGA